jgi:hypothetical protein
MCATTLVVSMLCLSRRVSYKNHHLTSFKIMICKDQLISSEVLPMGYFWYDCDQHGVTEQVIIDHCCSVNANFIFEGLRVKPVVNFRKERQGL